MSDIALTVSVLALVAVVGLWIGNIKVRGVGFGIGGVLFGGIIVGHFVDQAGVFRLAARFRAASQSVCCSDCDYGRVGHRDSA